MSTIPLHASRIFRFPERLELGPELIVNGDFSQGSTGWTLPTPTGGNEITISPGAMRFVLPSNYLAAINSFVAESGAIYWTEITCSLAPVANGIYCSGYSRNLTCSRGVGVTRGVSDNGIGNWRLTKIAAGNCDMTISNVSVRKILNWPT